MSSNQCAINMDNNGDQDRLQQVTQQTQALAVYDNTVWTNLFIHRQLSLKSK